MGAGFDPKGFDIDAAKVAAFAEAGGVAATLDEVARCDVVLLAVFDTAQVEDVVTNALLPAASAAPKTAAPAAKSAKARNTMRQFTGYVAAQDQHTLTVERRGRNPRSMVFTKHDTMTVNGDVAKDARVTVYYREEGGHSVAHRVVVRTENHAPAGS